MHIKKFIVCFLITCLLVSGTVALSGCGTEGKSAYDIWLDQGNTGTEQDFLDSLKVPGVNGKSAYDIWLDQGNTGTERDFLDSLKVQGDNGTDGSKWLYGNGGPTADIGVKGDLYLDFDTCNVYVKEDNGWTFKVCIKGEKGEKGDTPKVINAGSTYEYKITTPLEEGVYEVEMNLGDARLPGGGTVRLQAMASDTKMSDLCYSEKRSSDGKNIYFGYVYINSEATKIDISAIGENITFYGDISVKKWVAPTLGLSEDIEVPVARRGIGSAVQPFYAFKLASGLAVGKYSVVIVSEGDTIEQSVIPVNTTQIKSNDNPEIINDSNLGSAIGQIDPNTYNINIQESEYSATVYLVRHTGSGTASTTTPVIIRLVLHPTLNK